RFPAVDALAVRLAARLDVGGGVAFAQHLFDFVLDGAGDGAALGDADPGGDHDVEIEPVVPAAVAVAERVVADDLGGLARRAGVGDSGPGERALGPWRGLWELQIRGGFPRGPAVAAGRAGRSRSAVAPRASISPAAARLSRPTPMNAM